MNDTSAVYECDYAAARSRLTTFFRLLLVIPHWICLSILGIAVGVVVIIAWFALLVTGRWPEGMYRFVAGSLRYYTRVHAYSYLLVDPYPPFSLDEERGYPVRLAVPPPRPEYSRVKVLFRIILAIPVYILAYVMQVLAGLGSFVAWFVIVITGRQPAGLQELINLGFSYQARSAAYFVLLTEDWPAISDSTSGAGRAAPVAPEAP
jgi:hypothetical protein